MIGVQLTGHGGPDRLRVRDDLAVPEPGGGEVRVAVRAAAVNNTDIWTREGAYGRDDDPGALAGWRGEPIAFPRIQGADAVGTIDAAGPGVDPALVGRRVLVDPASYDRDHPDATPVGLMGSERDGAFAEHLVCDAARAHDVTGSPLDDHELAALPTAYGTALGMLVRAGVTAGDLVVVTGASGGVGLAAVQLASLRGAEVVAVSTAGKAQAVADAGAAAVVDREQGPAPALARSAAGRPVDAVIDVVGGEDFPDWPGALAPHGRIVVAGAVAGPVVRLDLRRLYLDQRSILGSSMHTPAVFDELVAIARAGRLRPPIAGTHPLTALREAQEAFARREHVGKITIDVAPA